MGQQSESQHGDPGREQSHPQQKTGSAQFSLAGCCDRFLKWLCLFLQTHLLSAVVIAVGLYVIFGLPQITNIWQQGPNLANGFTIWLLFWFYVFFLAGYYITAILIFNSQTSSQHEWMRHPIAWLLSQIPRPENWSHTKLDTMLAWVLPPIDWVLSGLVRFVVWSLSWIGKLFTSERSVRVGIIVGLVSCLVVSTGLALDLFEGWYSLSEIFWQSLLVWLGATTCWFLVCQLWKPADSMESEPQRPEFLRLSARLLSCLLVGYLFGEILWFLASIQVNVFSYRNYAIWGVYQTLIFFILLARGADQLSHESKYPVRLLTITGVAIVFVVVQPWMHYDNKITAEKFDLDDTDPHEGEHAHEPLPLAQQWQAHQHYDYLIERVQQTRPHEPVVFVAASGGGSRAAIFAALILEGLAREPIAPGYPKTWADQIVMISSVSGGSLASAHFVYRGMRESILANDGNLQSAIRSDLVHELPRAAREVAVFYGQDDTGHHLHGGETPSELIQISTEIEANSEQFFEQLTEHLENYQGVVRPESEAGKLGWILDARMIDEISLDFMAPLFRGATSLITPRGNALRDFWTDRFGWPSERESNVAIEDLKSKESSSEVYPLVLFNATNVRTGSRLVASYAINDKSVTNPPGKDVVLYLPDEYRAAISLSQAVRLSSNFPFGFPAARVDVGEEDQAEILDGGIVDNTGIDTIHAFFKQLIHDSELSDTRGTKARTLIDLLKERRVVLIEIDSGAKPEAQEDNISGGVFSPLTTPLDALNNASYNSAEVSKKSYLREINQIIQTQLSPNFNDPQNSSIVNTSVTSRPNIHFLCNYKEEPSAVMTAWALGPRDKASVIARFVLSWRKQQPRLSQMGKLYVEQMRAQARLAALLQGVDADAVSAVDQFNQIGEQVTRLPEVATAAKSQDIYSIKNAIGSVEQSVTKLRPDARPELDKIKNATQKLLDDVDSNNSSDYVKSKSEVQEMISQQTQVILNEQSIDRAKLQKYREQQEELKRLQSKQVELQNDFEKLEKIEAIEQRKALDRIRHSKFRE